jgi:hypothetical protein
MKDLRIFLASSNELKEERELFEISIYRKCQTWFAQKNIFLYLDIWENMSAKMSHTHSQDEYNKSVRTADIVVVLVDSKVGKYTFSEFENALRSFKSTNKPFIYIYFKKKPADTASNEGDPKSIIDFQDLLKKRGYFYPWFEDFNDLWKQFNKELDRLEGTDFTEIIREKESNVQNNNTLNVTGNNNKTYQGLTNSNITDNSTNLSNSGSGDNIAGDKIGKQYNFEKIENARFD